MGPCLSKSYVYGDFSFIQNKSLRNSITFDYNKCYTLIQQTEQTIDEYFEDNPRRSAEIDINNPPNLWDTPPGDIWKQISKKAYPYHDMSTYRYNMKILYYLKENSWNTLLKMYTTCKYPFT